MSTDAIARPTICRRCGYDVRSQPPDSVCPECGLPIRHSVFPAGLNLPNWNSARRVRAGLFLWISGLVLSTVLTIQMTLVLRHWHFLVDRGWKLWVRRSVLTWEHGTNLAEMISLAGIILIASSGWRRPEPWIRGSALLLSAFAGIVQTAILAYDYLPDDILPRTAGMSLAALPAVIFLVFRLAATLLFWIVLLQFVDRRQAVTTWRLLVLSLLGSFLLICFAAPRWYDQMFFQFCTTHGWSGDPWQVSFPWRWPDFLAQHVPIAGQVLMLFGVWPFLRLLNLTGRSRRPIPSGLNAPSPDEGL